jgi:hypothetical protein
VGFEGCRRLRMHNNGMQLTSGGPMRASRASSMRRLQLIPVLSGRWECYRQW